MTCGRDPMTTSAAELTRLTAILASIGDAVLIVDAEGQAVLTNTVYDELLRSLGGAFHPADEYGIPLPLDMTPQMRAARGETFTFDFTESASDDTARWFEATGRPLDSSNAGEGLVVIRDISDRSI